MALRNAMRSLLVWFRLIPKPDFYVKFVSIHPSPEEIRSGQMIVVGDRKFKKWVCLQCPDGCGENVLLSLSQSRRPSWEVSADWLGRPTVSPSVRKLDGCKSHFWVRQGKIDWCADSGK